jgi:tRNA(His) guanylyltransferase
MSLSDRMKQYERSWETELTYRLPVIIRLDGRSFHSFTRNCEEPFDDDLIMTMAKTAREVCKDIAGAQFAYTQSDEISILVTPYTSLNFEPHFGNRVQKLSSVTASKATAHFNDLFPEEKSDGALANFDARCFIVPKDDVENYFVWRQKDWERNSIQMLARSYFSHNECHGLSCDELQEKLWQEENVNWSYLDSHLKNGVGLYEEVYCQLIKELDKDIPDHVDQDKEITRSEWKIDYNIPEFSKDREFIRQFVYHGDKE